MLNGNIIFQQSEFDSPNITVMDYIRALSKENRYVGRAGIKEFCAVHLNATLRYSESTERWTSISFKNEEIFNKFIENMNQVVV